MEGVEARDDQLSPETEYLQKSFLLPPRNAYTNPALYNRAPPSFTLDGVSARELQMPVEMLPFSRLSPVNFYLGPPRP